MKKPYFLWDYDFTEKEVRKILKKGDEFSRRWLKAFEAWGYHPKS